MVSASMLSPQWRRLPELSVLSLGVEVLFGQWFAKADFLNLKNSIMKSITARFQADGIRFRNVRRILSIEGDGEDE
jgi:hypothetical protein